MSRSDSSTDIRSESIDAQDILDNDSDSAFNYELNMYTGEPSDFVENADEVSNKVYDEADSSVASSQDTGKAFQTSDKTVAIEISDDSEEQGISKDENSEVFKSSDSQAFTYGSRKDLSKKVTVIDKTITDSPKSCFEDIFRDDSSIDDELCNLDF